MVDHSPVMLFAPPVRRLSRRVATYNPVHLGVGSIAAYLEHARGISCDVYSNKDYSVPAIAEYIRRKRPAIIGFSCLSFNRFACIQIAQLAKRIDTEIITIFGGVHASCLDRQMLDHYEAIDYIVRGEGEITFHELVSSLLDHKDVSGISGLSFRRAGEVFRTPSRPRIQDLDLLPPIDFSRYLIDWYPLARCAEQAVPVETARGCPFECLFCCTVGQWGRKVVKKSVDRVIEQARMVPKRYRHLIYFHDMNLTLDQEYLAALCDRLLSEELNIRWICSTRIDLVNAKILALLKRAGCYYIYYGVESLSDKMLRSARKGYDHRTAIEHVNMSRAVGLGMTINLIVGFPHETERTMRETLLNAKKMAPGVDIAIHPLQIMPGAPLYEQAVREGFDENFWLRDREGRIPIYTGSMSEIEIGKWIKVFQRHLGAKV
jgi:anaerobic magnesium-protoporphyrin IX monomethyl ester cyclase